MTSPLISFVLPTYNRVEWVGETIMGLLAQTVKDIELIIVDDASDDGSDAIFDWALKDPRVKLIKNQNNVGGGMSRNIGMKAASAEIIGVCDSDDVYPDGRAEVTLDYFKKNPEATLVNFPYLQVGYFNEEIEKFRGEPFNHEKFKETGAINYFCNPNCAYKKAAMLEVGGYPSENEDSTDDAQMVKKWVEAGNKIDFDDKYFLAFHRVLPDSMMARHRGFDASWVTKRKN